MAGPLVQTQWDLSYTIFKTANLLFDLMKSAAQDNVQGQAVMALEGLGAGILVSSTRISDGYEALKQNNARAFKLLNVSIGLNGSGIASQMRKSTPLIAGFLFISACKPCYTDAEIGNILFAMMAANGLVHKVPISALQMGELVGSISGYCDHIQPHDVYARISEQTVQSFRSLQDNAPLYRQLDHNSIAEIFSKIFNALRDTDISKVTLTGYQSGVWIVNVFLWLLPVDDVHVTLDGRTIIGDVKNRLSVILGSETCPEWKIQEWTAEKDVVSVIKSSDRTSNEIYNRLMTLQPLHTTRIFLAHQWGLSEKQLEAVALLAGALITIAVEDGLIGSDQREIQLSDNSVVSLSDLCQPKFLATYSELLAKFGWCIDDPFRKLQADFVAHFRHWIAAGHDHQQYTRGRDNRYKRLGITEILPKVFSAQVITTLIGPFEDNSNDVYAVVESSTRLAGEAVLGCVCIDPPKYCGLRSFEYRDIQTSSKMLYQIIFARKVNDVTPFTIKEFLSEAIRANVPGVTRLETRHLAFCGNGHVIFASVLKEPATLPRDVCALSILPGTIRWGVEQMQYQAIQESESEPLSMSGRGLDPSVTLFNGSEYLGLNARASPHGYHIETFLSPSLRILWLRTYLCSYEPGSETVGVSWSDSIEALTVARVVRGPSMTAIGESLLAQTWQEQGVLNRVTWLSAHSTRRNENMVFYVLMTAYDETLRFFASGRYGKWKRIILRSGAPLIQCVQVAIDCEEIYRDPYIRRIRGSESSVDWIIVA